MEADPGGLRPDRLPGVEDHAPAGSSDVEGAPLHERALFAAERDGGVAEPEQPSGEVQPRAVAVAGGSRGHPRR